MHGLDGSELRPGTTKVQGSPVVPLLINAGTDWWIYFYYRSFRENDGGIDMASYIRDTNAIRALGMSMFSVGSSSPGTHL